MHKKTQKRPKVGKITGFYDFKMNTHEICDAKNSMRSHLIAVSFIEIIEQFK